MVLLVYRQATGERAKSQTVIHIILSRSLCICKCLEDSVNLQLASRHFTTERPSMSAFVIPWEKCEWESGAPFDLNGDGWIVFQCFQ